MTDLLKFLMQRNGYMAPAGDDGSDAGGGAVDRGDTFTADPDDDSDAEAAAAKEAALKAAALKEPEGDEKKPEGEEKKSEDDDKARDEKGRFIPKERFDEAVRKERQEKDELNRRLKEYQEREAASKVSEDVEAAQKVIKDLIKQHTSQLADGELDKASDTMEKILEMKDQLAERKAESKALTAKDMAKEEMRYDNMVARLESEYPQINPEADEYDKTVVRRLTAYMSGLMQTERMPASQALKEAAETLLVKPKADDKAAKTKADDAGLRRKAEAVAKAVDAKARQPASTKDVGLDHDKQGGPLDSSAVNKMTYEEFSKLPESKLAELRGDFVA